jgi:NADP-dependent 3-hydroxy acid dehydrogenase YdfG
MPVTLITGGTTGIGAATVRHLLDAGHRVAVTGRDAERLARFVKMTSRPQGGGSSSSLEEHDVLGLPGDATDYAAVSGAVQATVDRYGRLDAVVANAGFSTHDTLADGDPERWREMVLTNVYGPALLIRAALPALTGAHGRIVLMGSVAGFKNTPGNLYSVTKWAVTALAENTRMMVTGSGVGVTLVAPGRVDTPFWAERGGAPGAALTADDIGRTVAWALAQPPGVDVNTVVVRPVGQPI